nr:MAG TPA_asm: hypothetical protein [Caudoviricetes sp.]
MCLRVASDGSINRTSKQLSFLLPNNTCFSILRSYHKMSTHY